jgi:pimeloyl-ACP methyl ester carboxylesterase
MDAVAYWKTATGLIGAKGVDVLSKITVPVQVVAARNDLLVPVSQLEVIRKAVPHAEYLEVRDAGHAGLLEAGAEISDAVHAFVQRTGNRPTSLD